MASRMASQLLSRRFFSSGKVLNDQQRKASENVYIKKMEQERLEKLARDMGPKPEEIHTTRSSEGSGSVANHAKPSAESSSTSILGLCIAAVIEYFYS